MTRIVPERLVPLSFHYRVYGVTVSAACPIENLSGAAIMPPEVPDLTFLVHRSPAPPEDWGESEPLYVSPLRRRDGSSLLRIFRAGPSDILSFTEVADFCLSASGIVCRPQAGASAAGIEAHFLSSVLAYWLETRGRVCLHGSAASVDGRAVVFLSRGGGGKSGIVAALLRAGYTFLSDDIAALERSGDTWTVHRGFPVGRLWPDAARVFVGSSQELPRVGDGTEKRRVEVAKWFPAAMASGDHARCAALVVAGRRFPGECGNGVEMIPIRGRDVVLELIRHSFVGRLVSATGSPGPRFDALADLAAVVPAFRLKYPSGYERLPEVVNEIEAIRTTLSG